MRDGGGRADERTAMAVRGGPGGGGRGTRLRLLISKGFFPALLAFLVVSTMLKLYEDSNSVSVPVSSCSLSSLCSFAISSFSPLLSSFTLPHLLLTCIHANIISSFSDDFYMLYDASTEGNAGETWTCSC